MTRYIDLLESQAVHLRPKLKVLTHEGLVMFAQQCYGNDMPLKKVSV